MEDEGGAVGEGDQPEGEEVVESDRLLVLLSQEEDEVADGGAEEGADRQSAQGGPDDIDREPAPAETAEVVVTEEPEPEHDEGEGGAVVESGLAGETEAEAVAILRIGDLDVRGEHGIGRGEDGAEEDGGAEREVENHGAGNGDQTDRDRHRDGREAERETPERVAPLDPQFQPGGKEGDDDCDFGQSLDRNGVEHNVDVEQTGSARTDGKTDAEIDQRGRQRQAFEEGAADRHDDEQGADQDVEGNERHAGIPAGRDAAIGQCAGPVGPMCTVIASRVPCLRRAVTAPVPGRTGPRRPRR